MRKIMFRGKCDDKWHFGDLLHAFYDNELVIEERDIRGCIIRNRIVPATVGQFTGLRDADGREIYEGDIVSWGDGTPPTSVRWNEHFAYYVIMESLILSHACKAVRVIGNVYDNPELLEEAHV